MDISTENILNEYIEVLLRLTKAEYYFNVEGNKKHCTTKSNEYIELNNLFERIVPLYISLRDANVNPPRWMINRDDVLY